MLVGNNNYLDIGSSDSGFQLPIPGSLRQYRLHGVRVPIIVDGVPTSERTDLPRALPMPSRMHSVQRYSRNGLFNFITPCYHDRREEGGSMIPLQC